MSAALARLRALLEQGATILIVADASQLLRAPDRVTGQAPAKAEAEAACDPESFEKRMRHALAIIRKHGPITHREMIRRGFRFPTKELEEVLQALIQRGAVVVERAQREARRGRPEGGRYSLGLAHDTLRGSTP